MLKGGYKRSAFVLLAINLALAGLPSFADPASEAMIERARLLIRKKDSASARAILTKELANHPRDFEAHMLLGACDLMEEESGSALREFDACTAADKDTASRAYLGKASAHLLIADYKSMLQDTKSAQQLMPVSGRQPSAKQPNFDEFQTWHKGGAGLTLASDIPPEDAVRYLKVLALAGLQKFDEAVPECNVLVNKYGEKHGWLFVFMRGSAYQSSHKYDLAIKDLESASRNCPEAMRGAILRCLTGAYAGAGKTNQTDAMFSEIIRLNPRDESSYYARSQFYYAHKRRRDAIRDLTTAINLAPVKEPIFYYELRGINWFELGDYKKAIDDFTTCIGQAPQPASRSSLALVERAWAYERMGRNDLAKADRQKFAALEHAGAGTLGIYPSLTCVVTYIAPETSAAKAGLRTGDTIMQLNSKPCDALLLLKFLTAHQSSKVILDVSRAGKRLQITL